MSHGVWTRIRDELAAARRLWVEGAVLIACLAMGGFAAAVMAYLTLAPIFIVVELRDPHSTIEDDLRWAVGALVVAYLPLVIGRLGRAWATARAAFDQPA